VEAMGRPFVPAIEPEPDYGPGFPPCPDRPPADSRPNIARLRLLWLARKFLFRSAALGFGSALVVAFLLPKRYQSTTQIMPPDTRSVSAMAAALARSGGDIGGPGGLGSMALDLLGGNDSGSTFISILHSRTLQDRIIDLFGLMRVYGCRYRKDARTKLAERTTVGQDRKSGVIAVMVWDRDPHRAAALAQGYVDELNQLSAELNTSAAHRERVFIEQRLKAVKADLDEASKRFSEFSSKNTAIDIKAQGQAMVEAAATLQGRLIAAESQLHGLEQIYSDANVRVRSARAQVEELRRQLNKMGGTDESLQSRNGSSGSKDLYPSIRQLPLLGVQYADLYRNVKIQETVYELLTQQYELAKIEEAREIPSVKVLDKADVPEKKSFPPRLLISFSGIFVALIIACCWVLAKDAWGELEASHPAKVFIIEVYTTLKSDGQRLWSKRRHRRKDAIPSE
jgi:uncharacterized protein involved in exopolysaccharide biosynthesis